MVFKKKIFREGFKIFFNLEQHAFILIELIQHYYYSEHVFIYNCWNMIIIIVEIYFDF